MRYTHIHSSELCRKIKLYLLHIIFWHTSTPKLALNRSYDLHCVCFQQVFCKVTATSGWIGNPPLMCPSLRPTLRTRGFNITLYLYSRKLCRLQPLEGTRVVMGQQLTMLSQTINAPIPFSHLPVERTAHATNC